MTNVGNNDDANGRSGDTNALEELRREVSLLRDGLDRLRGDLASEVRCRSVVVVDCDDRHVIDLRAEAGGGRLVVGGPQGGVFIEAGPRTAGIDVTSGDPAVEMGIHLRADADDQSAVVALSGKGDILGEYHLLGAEDEHWRVEHIIDTR